MEDAYTAGLPLTSYLTSIARYRDLGAPVPLLTEAEHAALDGIELDEFDIDMFIIPTANPEESYQETFDALDLVRLAGRQGRSPKAVDERLRLLAPLGVTLHHADGTSPDQTVLWQDLLLLTVHLDGSAPAVSGQVMAEHISRAAEETEETTDWVIERLKLYAPLFGLALPAEHTCP